MTVGELASILPIKTLTLHEPAIEVRGVYCCDLLSAALGKAPRGFAWVTVMSNVNVVAVATLAQVACVVIADGFFFDEVAIESARGRISLLQSELPIFDTAASIAKLIV